MKKIVSLTLILSFILLVVSPLFSQVQASGLSSEKELLVFSSSAYYSTKTSTLSSEIDRAIKKKDMFLSTKEIKNIKSKWQKIYFMEEVMALNNGKVAPMGFAAVAYYNKSTNEIVVSYRGSADAIDFAVDDLNTYEYQENFQARMANGFLNVIISKAKNKEFSKYGVKYDSLKISITGHSLGGFLAQKAGIDLLSSNGNSTSPIRHGKSSQLLRVVTFNALGFGNPSKLSVSKQKNYITTTQWNNHKAKKYNSKIKNNTVNGELADVLNKKYKKERIGYTKFYDLSRFKGLTPLGRHKLSNFYSLIK